jgi:c-di-GMP-related signal transduction protein
LTTTQQHPPAAEENVFVARQPIFTKSLRVHGYELLFRNSEKNVFPNIDGTVATADLVGNAIGGLGLERLTGGKLGFVNFTRKLLVEDYFTVLPSGEVVIELLEDIEADDKVLAACDRLKAEGYTLALDDVMAYDARIERLLEYADIVKVDYLHASPEARIELVERVGNRARMLAEKVETRDEQAEAVELGYHFFQGNFLCEATIITGKTVSVFKPHLIELLSRASDPEFSFAEIEEIIRKDVSLSYRMLRFANSAASGLRQRVTSLGHALVILGQQEVARAAALLAMADMGKDQPDEPAISSLARASFMDALAQTTKLEVRPVEVFLTGLCSRLDAMLNLPMKDVVARLPLSEEVSGALMAESGELRNMLMLAEAYERADWDQAATLAEQLNIPDWEISGRYVKVIEYADHVFSALST